VKKKTQIWETRYLRTDQITGHMCAWEGCEEIFTGDKPPGWFWLVVYNAPFPQPWPDVFLTVPQADMPRDAVLCPLHFLTLERQLKALSRKMDVPLGRA
jgi:hypothetical protein